MLSVHVPRGTALDRISIEPEGEIPDRAVWLDHGRLMMLGPAGDVIDEYEGRLAAQAAK